MSLLTAIGNSLKGLAAIQADMQVISSNVSNAGREDYTKKHIILTTDVIAGGGTGSISVVGYGRAESANVDKLYRQSLSAAGLYTTQNDYLARIQNLLGSSQDSPVLTSAMSEFASAWRSLSAAPESSTLRQNVIYKAQNLTREVARLAAGLDQIKTDLQSEVKTSVDTLNASLKRIESLNNEIAVSTSSGQSAVDLMDLRDAEVKKISSVMKVEAFDRGDGRISLYTPGGYSLLDVVANEFAWNGTNVVLASDNSEVGSLMKGGKMEGLLGMLDESGSPEVMNDPGKGAIYKLGLQLDQLVTMFTDSTGSFATAYDSAATGTGEQASGFFTGTNRYSFEVAEDLLDGTTTVKQAAAASVADDMDLSNRSLTVGGITVNNVSYAGYTDAIIYTQNQNTKQISELATVYQSQSEDYKERLQNETGVNVDEEIVRLTQLQNNYSAISRVIQTVQEMLKLLDSLV